MFGNLHVQALLDRVRLTLLLRSGTTLCCFRVTPANHTFSILGFLVFTWPDHGSEIPLKLPCLVCCGTVHIVIVRCGIVMLLIVEHLLMVVLMVVKVMMVVLMVRALLVA